MMVFFFFFSGQEEEQLELPTEPAAPQPTVIPGLDSLTGDLLNLDLTAPAVPYQQAPAAVPAAAGGGVDLLGDGLDNLVSLVLDFNLIFTFIILMHYEYNCFVFCCCFFFFTFTLVSFFSNLRYTIHTYCE